MVKVSQATGPDEQAQSAATSRSSRESQIAAVATLSYEEARSQLVEIVTQLEQGSLPLEDSLNLWERGEVLAHRCQEWLDGARSRLEAVQSKEGQAAGSASTPEHEAPQEGE